jgi:hypothetical protein
MARTTKIAVKRLKFVTGVSDQERRVATPRPDLLLIKIGEPQRKLKVSPKERASGLLASVAKVMSKPGADRTRLFQSTGSKPVYAYFIYSKDPTKVVREDASGRQTIGRFVSRRFRRTSPAVSAT